jgi:predicted RNase H-like nuclease (RuvC/YqgF family)
MQNVLEALDSRLGTMKYTIEHLEKELAAERADNVSHLKELTEKDKKIRALEESNAALLKEVGNLAAINAALTLRAERAEGAYAKLQALDGDTHGA